MGSAARSSSRTQLGGGFSGLPGGSGGGLARVGIGAGEQHPGVIATGASTSKATLSPNHERRRTDAGLSLVLKVLEALEQGRIPSVPVLELGLEALDVVAVGRPASKKAGRNRAQDADGANQ